MNASGSRILHLAGGQTPLIAAGVVLCFAAALLGVWRFGLPIWSLLIPAAGAAYGIAVLRKPIIGLLVVISITYLPIQFGSISLLQVLGAGTAGLILLWALYQRRSIRLEPFLMPLMVFGVLIGTAFMHARDINRVAIFMRLWFFILVFVLLMTNLITRHSIFKKVIWTMISMASFNVLLGIYQYGTAGQADYRATGLFGHTSELGYISVTAFPLAFYQFLYRSDRLRWLALALSGLLFGGVVISAARTASFAIFVVVIATMISERRRIIPILLILVLALGMLPFLPDYYLSRVSGLANDAKNTILFTRSDQLTPRGMLNKAAIEIWLKSPIWGVGIGNFGHYFVEKEINPGFQRSNKVPPHNTYLQALAEMGVLGFLALIALFVLLVWHVFQARRLTYREIDEWSYHGGIQMMILVVLITCATGTNIMRNEFWLFLCLAPISHRVALSARSESDSAASSP